MSIKPFLKFPGGKRKIVDELVSRLPDSIERYFEPFVGGGALFFELSPINKAWISDVNSELILTYQVIRDDLEGLLKVLKAMPYKTGDNPERNRPFFERLRALDRQESFRTTKPVIRAARMIYLNKTCFNGLYRVNSQNQFNSPLGAYKNPNIVNEENLRACSEALQKTVIRNCSYEEAFSKARPGDFLYLDPPYVPISKTANFVSYSSDGFTMEDQKKLVMDCRKLHDRGVNFMLTNSNCEETHDLYKRFTVEVIDAPRSINRDGDGRKGTDIVVRNY